VTDIEPTTDTQLPSIDDNVERVVRYNLAGRPDFWHPHGGDDVRWAPQELVIKFKRRTLYAGSHVTERTDWRLTNVEMLAWRRLKSGNVSERSDLLVEFEDLPHEWTNRHLAKDTDYRKVKAVDFPYVAEIIDAYRPYPGELC
jgi:hypothetical protein